MPPILPVRRKLIAHGLADLGGVQLPAVFPGDLSTFGGVYGVKPMTKAMWLASKGAKGSANKAFDYQLFSTAGAGATGSIYYQNGKINPADVSSLNVYTTHAGIANVWHATNQVRIMKWYDQSGNGNHLTPPDINHAPVLGVVNGEVCVITGSGTYATSLSCALSAPFQMSTAAATMAVCCRPHDSYSPLGGGSVLYSALQADANGFALANNQNTSKQNWGWHNSNTYKTPVAILASSNRISATLTQSQTANACEIGVGANVVNFTSPYIGTTLTTAGFTIGVSTNNNFFGGLIFGAMFENATQAAVKTLSYRSALDYTYAVSMINETKIIVIGGVSTATGYHGYGVPQIAGGGAGADDGPISYGYSQFVADAIAKNYRIATVALASVSNLWTEETGRIPDVLNYYKLGATVCHFIQNAETLTDTPAQWVTNLQAYVSSFHSQAAGLGQSWIVFANGFTPTQNGKVSTYTNDDYNAAMIAAANGSQTPGSGFSYIAPVSNAVYNAALATYNGTNEFTVTAHWTATGASIVAGTEGANLAAAIN